MLKASVEEEGKDGLISGSASVLDIGRGERRLKTGEQLQYVGNAWKCCTFCCVDDPSQVGM